MTKSGKSDAEHILGDAGHILGGAETTFTNVQTISIGS